MKQQIIDLAINHWNEKFVGIAACDIANKLNLTHHEAMKYLVTLKDENKGSLNQNVSLGQISITIDEKTKIITQEHNTIVTHIFFPSKDILERFYLQNLNKFINNGKYKNRLHCGYSQIELVYFEIGVLDKYLRNKEKFTLTDDTTGGVLKLNLNYLHTLSDDQVEKIYFNKIWYGKRKLLNGNTSISAILSDLSGLNKKEQSYWYSFELENPEFIENDGDFDRFITRAYHGNFIDSDDPLSEISNEISVINKIFEFELFQNTENPYLTYPVNNTLKEFVDCNSELFKLIGPDNLLIERIKKVYLNYLDGKPEELINSKSQRPFSQIQILIAACEKLNGELASDLKETWETIRKNRIIADHKISKPDYDPNNYIDSFRVNCVKLREVLKRIKVELTKLAGHHNY